MIVKTTYCTYWGKSFKDVKRCRCTCFKFQTRELVKSIVDSPPFSLSPSSLTSSILPHPPPWVQFPGIATLQLGIEYLKVKWWLLTLHQFVKSWLQTTVVTIVNKHFHLLHPAWHFMTPLFYISWFVFLLSGVASEVGIWKSLEWMMKLGSSWKRWCQPSFVLVLLARWASLVLWQYQH